MTAAVASLNIAGVHPYADKYPLMSDDELDELAESIATVGLLHPIVITPDGLILDGRNRLEACNRAGIEPSTEVYEGDDLDLYVVACNSGRRHMSPSARAAADALVLADQRRRNGRWMWGTNSQKFGSLSSGESEALRRAGIVLDHLPNLLTAVINGMSMNEAYEQACAVRDEAQSRAEQEEADRQAEDEAREFITDKDPDLAADVKDPKVKTPKTFREALAIWEQRNRDEARKRAQAKRDHEEAIKRDANRIRAFLSGFDGAYSLRTHPSRADVLDALSDNDRKRFLRIEKEITWPSNRI